MTNGLPTYRPTRVSPPGSTLADLLDERGMSQAELARRMGRPEKTISEIVNGKAAITPETALQLESVFDVPARFWVNREANYRAALAEAERDQSLRGHATWARQFPLPEMRKRGWIGPGGEADDQVKDLLSYFSIASPEQWQECTRDYHAAYRAHPTFELDEFALSTWLQAGRVRCERRSVDEFDADRLQLGLQEVRAWTRDDPKVALSRVADLTEKAGVVLSVVPELPRCRVSGATMWVGQRRAVIQLSLRFKTDDQLWFTFFHEAAHLLLHSRREIFLERAGGESKSEREIEADLWACDFLIPGEAWDEFVAAEKFGKSRVEKFAEAHSIAPSIVVGRLQHERRIRFSRLNELKRRVVPEDFVELGLPPLRG